MSVSAFAGGFLNPLTTPAHVLTWLSLGILIGRQASGRLVPVLSFAAGLAGGLAAIAHAIGLTPALDVLLLTSAASGAIVAAGLVVPPVLSTVIALVAGVALGLDSPPQVLSIRDATAALLGTWLAGTVLLVIVAGATRCLTSNWQRIGLRIAGSWIAASAMLVLALRFARGMLFAV